MYFWPLPSNPFYMRVFVVSSFGGSERLLVTVPRICPTQPQDVSS